MVGELLPKFTDGLVGSLLCPFCKSSEETINHIFIKCKWSLRLWSTCLSWWEILACLPEKLNEWMDCWQVLCQAAKSIRVWMVAFHAIYWSIWDIRNEVVFKQGVTVIDRAVEMVIWRVVCVGGMGMLRSLVVHL
ncbi:hypothetical protein LWI28_006964 [Acer negundo]|uniref:Reverse transcriptase zinc-binding domain-containing protein n=1 Tax=Acer negundo TaxID=4023 RepID=A0AAD5NH86_ACENE|nr:hypothetical protein LWI28_006964 [Acer negundo]